MSCNVAFIGLGVMGYPMAGYISKGGHNVTVYNRTGAKADKWLKEFKGKKADTPKDAAKDADYVFTCVGNDNDLREVTFGENGIFKSIKKLYPHEVNLQLYQVHAVTEGTDAQATVSVRIEEEGKTTVGQAADTDTLVASANAYINALNKMIIKRKRNFAPDSVEIKKNQKNEKMKGI